MTWVDYLLLVVLALSAWSGLAQGFFRSALGVVVVGLGMFAAFKYFRPVGEYLDRGFDLGTKLETLISGWLGHGEQVDAPVGDPVPETAIDLEGFSGLLDQFLAGQLDGLGQAVTGALAPAALSVLSFLIVFILTVRLGGCLLSRVPYLPFLGPVDRAGGFVFGLARGFVYGLIVLVAVKFMSFSGVVFGSDLFTTGLDGSQLASAYFAFLHYIWALIMPLSG
ncbi:MAG: CvpA family protein [Candidatus Desulforudis sp.]|nr:CvpA family protein [Desulforudis sp.]